MSDVLDRNGFTSATEVATSATVLSGAGVVCDPIDDAATPVAPLRAVSRPLPNGQFDWWLFGTASLLIGLGLLMTLSASSSMADQQYGDALHFFSRQVGALMLGLVFATATVLSPWRTLRNAAWPMYGIVFIGLLLVFSPLGHAAKGAHRWVNFAGINQQPSEYAKIALILVMSRYLAANEGRLQDFFGTLIPALSLVVPFLVLILPEPDFGTSVLLVAITGLLLFVAGLRWRWVGLLGGLAAFAGVLLVAFEPYRLRRFTSFLDPFADPGGAGYQVVQGWIALANGGIYGQGLAAGLAQRGFLPEAHTDFISAVVAEELGALGWIGLLSLYAVLIWRGITIATRSPDLFGTLVATGLTGILGMQTCINLGVVVGWLPAKGLVLPFMSYGASAVTVHVMAVGLLLRIGMQGHAVDRLPVNGASR